MSEERGPSYWDVSEYVSHLEAKYGKSCRWLVSPPRRVGASATWSSWCVYAEMYDPSGKTLPGPVRAEYFGKGGAWKTLPAALHASLRNLEERLEAAEEQARAQARF